jgi:3-hydroxybutyryl-CoA dehydratase
MQHDSKLKTGTRGGIASVGGNALHLEDLSVGMSAVYSKTITDADVLLFSAVSGDTNPVHLDQEFAAQTQFKGRIAHGMLTASLLSAVLGTKLPGPGCIYISQELRFRAPVRVGDTVQARVVVEEIQTERRRARLQCSCTVAGKVVLEGAAVVMVDSRLGIPQAAE